MISNLNKLFVLFLLMIITEGCGIYSFTGASIPPGVTTFQVNFFENLASFQQNLFQIMQNKFHEMYQIIDQYEKRLLSPQEKIKTQNILIENLSKRIQTSMLRYLEMYQNKVESLEQSLILLNPNEILSRGYAIAFSESNKAITNVEDISLNDKIKIKLHHGLVNTSVTDKTNG